MDGGRGRRRLSRLGDSGGLVFVLGLRGEVVPGYEAL
jgi:hypothetical protein